jgi:excisionase family DNA binding protein
MRTKPLVDAQAVARRFSVSIGTVNRWVRSGTIPCLRPSRRVVRFNLSEVEAALQHITADEKEEVTR